MGRCASGLHHRIRAAGVRSACARTRCIPAGFKGATGISGSYALKDALDDIVDFDWESLKESADTWIQTKGSLNPGTYILTEDVLSPVTGEMIGYKNSRVMVKDFTAPKGYVFNTPIYEVLHVSTKQKLYISIGEIQR